MDCLWNWWTLPFFRWRGKQIKICPVWKLICTHLTPNLPRSLNCSTDGANFRARFQSLYSRKLVSICSSMSLLVGKIIRLFIACLVVEKFKILTTSLSSWYVLHNEFDVKDLHNWGQMDSFACEFSNATCHEHVKSKWKHFYSIDLILRTPLDCRAVRCNGFGDTEILNDYAMRRIHFREFEDKHILIFPALRNAKN